MTYANVVASLCLFLLIGGGTAFAASHLSANSVGAKQLKKGAVTPAKLSKGAKEVLIGAPGAQGPGGLVGPAGAAGSPVTSEPLAIDASAPESPLATTDSMLVLNGRTSWTAPGEPAGLLLAQLKLKLATAAPGESCSASIRIFANGEPVAVLDVGVPPGGFGNPTTLTDYKETTPPTGIGLVDRSETQTITAEYVGVNTVHCVAGSKFEGLRIIVQPLG